MLDVLVRILVGIALLILAVGSLYIVVLIVTAPTPGSSRSNDYLIGVLIFTRMVWPLVLCVVGLCGGAAFFLVYRRIDIVVVVWLVLAGLYVLVQRVTALLVRITQGQPPLRGLPAVVFILLFVVINAFAIYVAWRYILQAGAISPP